MWDPRQREAAHSSREVGSLPGGALTARQQSGQADRHGAHERGREETRLPGLGLDAREGEAGCASQASDPGTPSTPCEDFQQPPEEFQAGNHADLSQEAGPGACEAWAGVGKHRGRNLSGGSRWLSHETPRLPRGGWRPVRTAGRTRGASAGWMMGFVRGLRALPMVSLTPWYMLTAP